MALSVVGRGAAFVARPVAGRASSAAVTARRGVASQRVAAAAAGHGQAGWGRPAGHGQAPIHAYGSSHAKSLVRLWSSAPPSPGSEAASGTGGEGEKDEEEVARLKAERERRKEEKAAVRQLSRTACKPQAARCAGHTASSHDRHCRCGARC